jgi:hypothetical protein
VGGSVVEFLGDNRRCSSGTFVSRLAAGLFLAFPFLLILFLTGGNGGRGSGGMFASDVRTGQGESGKLKQGKDDDFFTLRIEGAGGRFIESVLQECVNVERRSPFHRPTVYETSQDKATPKKRGQTDEELQILYFSKNGTF